MGVINEHIFKNLLDKQVRIPTVTQRFLRSYAKSRSKRDTRFLFIEISKISYLSDHLSSKKYFKGKLVVSLGARLRMYDLDEY